MKVKAQGSAPPLYPPKEAEFQEWEGHHLGQEREPGNVGGGSEKGQDEALSRYSASGEVPR